jgi:uncharacterized membrane-anchored protein
MLVPALIVFLPYVITVSLLVVAVILVLKSRRTHDPVLVWLAVAAVVWPFMSRLLADYLDGGSRVGLPLNLLTATCRRLPFVSCCVLSQ